MLYNFDDVFTSFGHLFNDDRFSYREPFPPTNLFLNEDGSWEISLALAGYDKSELSVKVESGSIIIEADPVEEESAKAGKFYRQKIKKNAFKRTYALDSTSSYDFDSTSVTFENGLLTVRVPVKVDAVKSKYIEIM